MTKRGENVCIYLARKNHLCHFQSVVVGHASAFDDCLLDAQLPGQIAQLFPAPVDYTDTNANLMQQSKFFAERDQPIMVFGDFTRKLNDKSLAFKALDVRQRFAQEVQSQLASNFAGVGHLSYLRAFLYVLVSSRETTPQSILPRSLFVYANDFLLLR